MGMTSAGDRWLMVALVLSSLLNILYLLPVAVNAFMKKPNPAMVATLPASKPPLLTVLPPMLTAFCTLVLFFMVGPIMNYLRPVFEGGGL